MLSLIGILCVINIIIVIGVIIVILSLENSLPHNKHSAETNKFKKDTKVISP